MPLLTLKYEPNLGPILEVGLAKPLSIKNDNEKNIPPAIRKVRLLVDTGAAATSISPRIATELELPIIAKVQLRSVTHEVPSNLYLADMIWTVGQPTPLYDVRLMEFPMADDSLDGLLGRDFLSSCLMTLNGPYQTITLAY